MEFGSVEVPKCNKEGEIASNIFNSESITSHMKKWQNKPIKLAVNFNISSILQNWYDHECLTARVKDILLRQIPMSSTRILFSHGKRLILLRISKFKVKVV